MLKPSEEKFLAFFEGNCSQEDLKEMHAWIKESEDNAKELFELESVYRQVKASAIPDSQIENAYRKIYHIKTQEKLQAKKARSKKMWYYSAAAMLCVVLVFAVMMGGFSFLNNKMLVAQAPNDAILKLMLNDSTKVWLNKNTKLFYPREFSRERRIVKIDGEAYFDVASDKKRPFIVEGKKMKVSVLGTEFNFYDDAKEEDAVVSLFEGSVQVEGNHNEGKIRIIPGQTAYLHSKGKYISVEKRNDKLNELWHNNKIQFNNANVENIAKTLESIYKVQIDVDKKFNADETYSGTICKSNSLDSVLSLLQEVIPMKYEIENNVIKLTKSNH